MKYIRTKDGRILKVFQDNVSLCQENDGLAYYGKETFDFETSCYLPKSQILKPADTIEELCDVLIAEKHGYHYILKLIEEKFYALCSDNELREIEILAFEVYGAIWTDKGLIYVAKMNEKGELELL